ncbi:hypothetical protein NTE_02517 [Candidatus Nitrososphaera evergladensis SR1]|uniref:Uncharacterized protein n=1 Tax=Candidatus Nitrososphaera evergladensis SR1 TaxID=1459636 RepID=A0A075MSL3_9ARCH|nr:hypothetical protein [Candidatus Nitrososphaera evergladensis]AIF84566.1 hypothetical protein NTE_02517 [Candidatus Nitrososphaera evergladensis SR1]
MDSSNLEKVVLDLQKRVASLEQAVYGSSGGSSNNGGAKAAMRGLEQRIVEKVDDIGTQDLILVALLQNPKQSKARIRQVLNDWGKAYGSWFEGGNFSGRLVKAGLVKKDGSSDDGEELFSLTKKGEMEAGNLVSKL